MADVLFIGLMVVFFALAVGLVRLCDRVIGPDDEVIVETDDVDDVDVEVAA